MHWAFYCAVITGFHNGLIQQTILKPYLAIRHNYRVRVTVSVSRYKVQEVNRFIYCKLMIYRLIAFLAQF